MMDLLRGAKIDTCQALAKCLARPSRVSLPVLLLCAAVLVIASLGCSVGQALVGRSTIVPPTVTKTPRPTFTPLAGATPSATPVQGVRGVLPPGVTAAPDPASELASSLARAGQSTSQEGATGSTNVVLYATETPLPTVTPAPTAVATATSSATPDTETNRPQLPAGPRPFPTPYVVVASDVVNGRRGPGVTFEVVGQAQQGAELMILGRVPNGDWWQVCCISNQPAWVSAEFVTPKGPLEDVPVLTPPPTPRPTTAPPAPATVTATPTRLPPFDVARGPEFPIKRDTGVLTIWVKVYEGPSDNQTALSGYVLKVFRNTVDASDHVQSHGPPFDSSKPEGAFEYNLKFEMLGAGEADWQIYLASASGYRVSPIRQFTTKGDSYRNLVVFIAYWLAR